MKLNNENIEEQILLLADGELDEPGTAEVMAYIAQHTEYKPMLDAYLACRLDGEETFIFPGKEALLKEEPLVIPLKRTFSPAFRRAAAVAAILGIGAVAALMLKGPAGVEQQPMVALQQPLEKKDSAVPVNAIQQPTMVVAEQAKQKREAPTSPKQKEAIPKQRIAPMIAAVPESREQNNITPLTAVQEPVIAMASAPVPAKTLDRNIPEYKAPERLEIAPSWLPIKEESLDGINELVAQVQMIRDQVTEKARMLKKATFVLRFGDKEVALGKQQQ